MMDDKDNAGQKKDSDKLGYLHYHKIWNILLEHYIPT